MEGKISMTILKLSTGEEVSVSDNFLNLSPEDQQLTVEEIVNQISLGQSQSSPIEQKKGFIERAGEAVSESGGVLPYIGDVGRAAGQELSDIGQAAKMFGQAGAEAYGRSLSPFNRQPTPALKGLGGLAKEGAQAVMKDPMLIPRGIGEEVIDTSRSFSDPFQKAKERPIETASDLMIAGKLLKPVLKGAKKIANLGKSKVISELESPEGFEKRLDQKSLDKIQSLEYQKLRQKLDKNQDIIKTIQASPLTESGFSDAVGTKVQRDVNKLTDRLIENQRASLSDSNINPEEIMSRYRQRVKYLDLEKKGTPEEVLKFQGEYIKPKIKEDKKTPTGFRSKKAIAKQKKLDREKKQALADAPEDEISFKKIFEERLAIDGKINYTDTVDPINKKKKAFSEALSEVLKSDSLHSTADRYRHATAALKPLLDNTNQKKYLSQSKTPGMGANMASSYRRFSPTQKLETQDIIKKTGGRGTGMLKRDLKQAFRTLETMEDLKAYSGSATLAPKFMQVAGKTVPIQGPIELTKLHTLGPRQRLSRGMGQLGRLAPPPIAVKAATEMSQRTPAGNFSQEYQEQLINQRRR